MTVTTRLGPLWIRALGGGILLLILALITPGLARGSSSSGSAASMAVAVELIFGAIGVVLVLYGAWLLVSGQRTKE